MGRKTESERGWEKGQADKLGTARERKKRPGQALFEQNDVIRMTGKKRHSAGEPTRGRKPLTGRCAMFEVATPHKKHLGRGKKKVSRENKKKKRTR